MKYVKRILIALIVLYPLAGAFFGLDLGDTGYHIYAYTHLVSDPDKINYTTYLSSVVGYLWDQIFGWMGLIAFNLLEVLLEWSMALIVYKTLRRELGEITVLAGTLFAVIASDCYLNVFNYHQFNVFFLTAILCLEYKAITENRKQMSLAAGVLYVLLVFSRVGSVVALITAGLYLYYTIMNDFSWKETGKHFLYFAGGSGICGIVLAAAMAVTGRMGFFVDNIFRLGGIAADSSTAYGFNNLLKSLITENLKVIASGFVFYAAAALFLYALNIALHKCETKLKRLVCVLLGIFTGGVAVYQMYFATKVNPADPWVQMTSGPKFLIGVMYVTAFGCFAWHVLRKNDHSQRVALLVIASCMMVLLTIAGSNTGTKHVILAMWLIAPICMYTVRKVITSPKTAEYAARALKRAGLLMRPRTLYIAAAVAGVMFLGKFGHMVYYTFNYDSVQRTKLTATVDNDKVRGIFTTKEQADALNGVLDALEEYDEDQPLMVVGNSLLFYYMSGREPYGKPWVTQQSYPLESLKQDMKEAEKEYGDTLPIILYCRTNYSYGFDKGDLWLNQQRILNDSYDGKKDYLMDFMREHKYGYEYVNDYYAVVAPDITRDMKGLENIVYGR